MAPTHIDEQSQTRLPRRARASTRVEPRPLEALRRARWERRWMIGALVLFVLAGALGYFGSKTSTVTAEAGGYRFIATYAQITRPGLPIRWVYQVERPGGFSGPIRITTTFDYLHALDTTNILPDPTDQASTSDEIVWDFAKPPGDTLRVSFDAAVEVGFHPPQDVTAAVIVGGRRVVEVRFRTVVVP